MPNNNPRTPKRSWRGDRPASPRSAQGQPAWKAEKGGPGGRPRVSRNFRLFIVLVLFLLVAGSIVAVYYWLRPPDPFRLVLVGAGYEQNLAVQSNVLGRRGLDGLKDWADAVNKSMPKDSPMVDVHAAALDGDTKDPVAEGLVSKDLLRGFTSKTVVVFLTGDGGGDAQGAYLWLDGANPKNSTSSAYRISSVLAALGKLPADTKKLLLLDGSHNGVNWSMGQLHNDFVRAVKNEPGLGQVKNLVVLCSCDVDQRSWDSEEYGSGIFAHFVIEGLKGAADQKTNPDDPEQCGAGDGDGRVTAMELVRYVQCQVARWVRRNRGFDQKPLLLGDEGVAAGLELVGADAAGYKKPDPAAVAAWAAPDDLETAWQEHEDLANSAPPPASYAPQQWRQYEAALLRYEQLLRGDDKGSAGRLRERLGKLHDQIVQAQRLDRDSLTGTLAAPAVFGWSLSRETAGQLKDGFDQLWREKAKPEQFQRLLAGMQDAAPNRAAKRLLRVRLTGLLLDKAPASHDEYLRVCAVLPKLADPPAPPPAEANFAVMAQAMEAALPGKAVASWDRLEKALTVRRTAEAAAFGLEAESSPLPAYSEQAAPWFQSAVEQADIDRRLGEDLLFASLREDGRAAKALSDADGAYGSVQKRALVVRKAIQARDQALAELPWYTQWLARQPLAKADEDPLVALWAAVHDLCDLLDKPDPATTAALGTAADAVDAGVRTLRSQFTVACGDGQPRPILQRSLHELDDLLTVPLIEPRLRTSLLKDARRISRELNVQTEKAAGGGDDKLQDAAARAKALAFQQARLAAAVLGKDNEEGKKESRLLPPFEKELWQPDLNEAGDLVGRGFQNLARDAAEAAEKGRRAPLKDAAAPLRVAALKTRFLDAAEADAWLTGADPVDENRRAQLHDLLVWQAERTRLDYWASDDSAHPYYRAAGRVYTGDASDLAAGEPDLKEEEKTARQQATAAEVLKLSAPDAVAFRWQDGDVWKEKPEKLHLTDEKTIQLPYGLAGRDAPPGRPVVWARPGPKLIAPPDAGEPRPLERLSDQPAETSVTYLVTPDRPADAEGPNPARIPPPAKEDSDFEVRGLFRGRPLAMDTPVVLHNRPDLVSYQPELPPTARIAVQATREDFNLFAAKNSELVIVLDYSGSMTSLQKDGSKRIDKAREALQKCLKKLPTGVHLTVLTFSADSLADIAVQRERAPWSLEQTDDLMEKLKRVSPKGYTPLVRATTEAAKYFTPNFKGAKTIVVLTDGGDNEFHSDTAEGRAMRAEAPTMKKYLHNKFDGTGILVNVVGFQLGQLDQQDEIDGYKEFKPAIEDVGGTFDNVDDADKLAEKLQQYFLQIRFWVEDEQGAPVDATAQEGLRISLDTENLRPSITVPAPGSYYVLIQAHRNQDRTRRKLLDQHVRVERGEVLVLDLKDGPDGFDLRRDVYAQSYKVRTYNPPLVEPRPAGNHWLLAALGNARVQNAATRDARDLTVSLERTDDFVPLNGTLRQSRPTLAWFSVTKEGSAQPISGLRFYPTPNYPAPVWRLNLADWQAGSAPVLNAWWYEDALPEGVVLRQGREYTRPSELKRRPFEVRPTEDDALTHVVVESVGWEPRTVEVRPGQWARDVDCLVVRLRYPEGRPYFVQLPDEVRPAGFEHRFYWDANKYTGVFYGVQPAQVEGLAWLKLISVEAAHRKAVRVDGLQIRRDGDPPQPIDN